MYIVIVGAGDVGFFLAKKLLADNHQVCFIEKSDIRAKFVSENTSIPVLQGDGTEPWVMKEARMDKADTLVALTSQDEINIIACQIAKDIFKVKRTIGKVNDPKNLKIFSSLGVDIPIDSTTIIASIVEEEASFTDFINLLSIKKGKLSIVKLDLPESSPFLNKKLRDITLPSDVVLAAVLRRDEVIIPKGDTALLLGDEIIAITSIDKEKELIDALIGKL